MYISYVFKCMYVYVCIPICGCELYTSMYVVCMCVRVYTSACVYSCSCEFMCLVACYNYSDLIKRSELVKET